MPSFPSVILSRDNVKIRFLDPVPSQNINQRFMGLPRGVYVGYEPQVTPASPVLTLSTDAQLGFSSLKVGAASTAVQVDVFTNQSVLLDFTGHTQFPVYVIARADYVQSFPTQGRILTRATGPVGPQEVGICVVNKSGPNLVIGAVIPGQRQPPLAFSGQAAGFMYGGATDDIVTAQGATNEVIFARTSLSTGLPSPRLADRLALDLAADYIASQIGLRTVGVVGNAQIVTGGSGTANVSASFGALTRQMLPAMTINAGGTEIGEGAITAPADTERNVCFLIDDTTGARVVDANANAMYGRLAESFGVISGTLGFTNALPTVQGTGTNFGVELQVGDLILGADTNLYSVTGIAGTQLTIAPSYQGANASGFMSVFRRFTLTFYSRGTGSEVATPLPGPVNLRFFFAAWFRADRSIFDATTYMKRDGERPVEPIATSTIRGRALLAVAGALVGSIFQISSNQTPVGSTNFHTLNFNAVNASVVNAGGGQANITVPGNPGPPGPGANPGPSGPLGPYGPGARNLSPFVSSALLGPGGSGSFTVDFSSASPPLPGSVVHAVGGISQYDATGLGFGGCGWHITGISVAGTMVTLNWQLDNTARGHFYLGASY